MSLRLIGISFIAFTAAICLALAIFIRLNPASTPPDLPFLGPTPTPTPLPLLKYSFDNLMAYEPQSSPITLTKPLDSITTPTAQAYEFTYTTEDKIMSGLIVHPAAQATPSAGFPVILMLRGFVDPSIYTTGIGTKNVALRLAENGFVAIAPDFFGFGSSDYPDSDIFGERLQKPLNLLDLIASLETLPFINPDQLGIWAHSNGGQIALSLLEITAKPYPTVLWAPVSKSFPYSILFYTDEYDDQGKALRANLSRFESTYDVFDFSIDRYWEKINAPIEIHQGTADDAVPYTWSQALAKNLPAQEFEPQLFLYPGADHNLRPSWEAATIRTLDFYYKYLL
jgi:uncharacterized protein